MRENILETYLDRLVAGVPLRERLGALDENTSAEIRGLLRQLRAHGIQLSLSEGGLTRSTIEVMNAPELPDGAITGLDDPDADPTTVDSAQAKIAVMLEEILHTLSGARDAQDIEAMARGYGGEIDAVLSGNLIAVSAENLDALSELSGRREACEVTVEIPPQVKAKANVHRLHMILTNLIKNADNVLKQSGGTGEVHVSIAEKGGEIIIEVTDNAGGIPDQIFQNLWSGGKSATGGTGTGLKYCRKMLEGWGRIEAEKKVEWEEGEGARFTIRLEAIPEDTADVSFLSERPINPNLIFAIDDHPVNRLVLGLMLRTFGECLEIVTAESALDAIAQMKTRSDAPAVIFTDDQMRGITGLELANKIRRVRGDITIVIQSATLEEEKRKDFPLVRKPIDVHGLSQFIKAKPETTH